MSDRHRARTPDSVLLPEAENGQQSLVDAPLLLWSHPAHKVAQAACVDCANLLHEDAGDLAQQVDLRPERRGSCAARCRGYEHYRAGQQLVGLDDYTVSAAMLRTTRSACKAERVNVTAEHACAP